LGGIKLELQYIRSITLTEQGEGYPFTIPAIKAMQKLNLHKNVTFFIGENGTGKSTLLEAIAVNYGFNPEGGSRNFNFGTYESHSILHEKILLAKGPVLAKDGYFLRAESYYNVASEIERLDNIPCDLPAIKGAYGGCLHNFSHGESFFALLQNRLFGNGLYLLDEPEAALSPMRQIEMLSIIDSLVKRNSQFIIATHSPILLSYPHSTIYAFSEDGITKTPYVDTEHYRTTKYFLNNHEEALMELNI